MSIFTFIKKLVQTDSQIFDEITPQYLEKERSKYATIEEYKKRLRQLEAELVARSETRRHKGLSIPKAWNEKIDMVRTTRAQLPDY